MRKSSFSLLLLALLIGLGVGCSKQREEVRLLVFSKTAGYRHESITAGKTALLAMAKSKGWAIDTTEDAGAFTEENLPRYSAIVFLNTTGDILNTAQQRDFERYVQAGGGFVGIHAASDTEYDWPWYGRLMGAWFNGHPSDPNVREATMNILSTDHPSTAFFTDKTWVRSDEFYNFKKIYTDSTDGIVPLIEVDETTYEGGTNGDFHPMSWYHNFDGGRAWYTNFGHTSESFSEELFLKHLQGGIEYAIGENLPSDYSKAKTERYPEEDRFVITVLDENLNEPGELDFLPGGKILYTQRHGELMMFDPAEGKSRQVGKIPVFDSRADGSSMEEGLVGMALDPNFAENNWIYLFYSPVGEEPKNVLSRFEFRDSLLLNTEKVMLEVATQRQECCHTGGSIQFDKKGLLYLSTGDNTNPFETAYAPINELEGRGPWDGQKSSGNMNDLRGKILRIQPMPDGTYRIPEGNLFPADGSKGRPEIFVMGCRNPYRISVDSKTGFVYWGDVGPDASNDSTRGPRGYDEVNQARKAGFFGWPYFVGNNYPYRDVNFADQSHGELFDAVRPVNNSPNNTGGRELPSVSPAFIYYPYANSPDFPMLGSGGRNAMAGPVFYSEDFATAPSRFPAYYNGKLFIYDFMRDWVFAVNMRENGDLDLIEPFLPEALELSSPMDMEFGPDGAMYILTYGTRWFARNSDAKLIKVQYVEGNREPIAKASVAEAFGAAPFNAVFSSEGSVDLDDEDKISYAWDFGDGSTSTEANPTHTYASNGAYTATLTVKDPSGATREATVEVKVGNAPPQIAVELGGNRSFFFSGGPVPYRVAVTDSEDGSLGSGIDPARVAVSFEYLDQTEDRVMAALGHEAAVMQSLAVLGQELVANSGCIACHGIQEKIVGPAYTEVAKKYASRPDARAYLTGKILGGGSGVWGGQAMPAQEQLSENQAVAMAVYILGLQSGQKASLGTSGVLKFDRHKQASDGSSYLLTVSYQDQGGGGQAPVIRQEMIRLRSPRVQMEDFELAGSQGARAQGSTVQATAGAVLNMGVVDLTGLESLLLASTESQGAVVELRMDSPEGPLLGSSQLPSSEKAVEVPMVLENPAAGEHRIYLVVKRLNGGGGRVALDWLEFLQP